EVAFENLDAGGYVIEFTFADLPPLRESLRLERFQQENVAVAVDYTTLYGRVTVGGEKVPSPVRVAFDFTQAVYTNDDGDYSVVLRRPLKADGVISLRSCDGRVDGEQIVDRDVLPNARYDIDLPANRVTVEAADADSGAPIAGALIRYGAFRGDEMSSHYYFRLAYAPGESGQNVPLRTGADGRYVIRNLPPEKTLRVCLEHDDYERTCAEPLTLRSTQASTLRIDMKPKNGFGGRIVGANDVAAGQLYWFSADGRETERTVVKPDGTFRFNRRHDPGEAVVFVSANLPLFAFPQPFLGEHDPMNVTMPPAPSRSFAVAIDPDRPQQDAVVTIEIGGLVVPYPPFAQHLALHGSHLDIRNRGPLLVPDILQTGPISVILGPPLDQVTPAMRVIDLFRLPQFRSLPRKPVGAEGTVVFAVPRGPVATW
ncbi:MAG: carboxypeptidase-like regulatory domain-containing protein, partial [Acidobacteriota bacterium]|nr:carboxypeptidase-like regulatory domain-containing protein [Acidobacteriota bacterium]